MAPTPLVRDQPTVALMRGPMMRDACSGMPRSPVCCPASQRCPVVPWCFALRCWGGCLRRRRPGIVAVQPLVPYLAARPESPPSPLCPCCAPVRLPHLHISATRRTLHTQGRLVYSRRNRFLLTWNPDTTQATDPRLSGCQRDARQTLTVRRQDAEQAWIEQVEAVRVLRESIDRGAPDVLDPATVPAQADELALLVTRLRGQVDDVATDRALRCRYLRHLRMLRRADTRRTPGRFPFRDPLRAMYAGAALTIGISSPPWGRRKFVPAGVDSFSPALYGFSRHRSEERTDRPSDRSPWLHTARRRALSRTTCFSRRAAISARSAPPWGHADTARC
jgi:hypothetical protein